MPCDFARTLIGAAFYAGLNDSKSCVARWLLPCDLVVRRKKSRRAFSVDNFRVALECPCAQDQTTMSSTIQNVLLETNLPGVKLFSRGKVRDVYELGDKLLVVATRPPVGL